MRIDVWGTLRIHTPTQVVTGRDFPGIKPKELLEILVAERGHIVSKLRLADLLWPDAPGNDHVATLETYVSVARRTIQPGVRARDSVIVTEPGGYRLDADRTTLDLEEFDRLVREAAELSPLDALAALNTALALIRGPAFEDEPYADWTEPLRASCAHKHVQVLVDAGRLSLVTGEAVEALALAEQAVAADPFAEAAYQILMTASYALWRQEDALRAFERCRKLLADELGVDPMGETVALHMAILRHEDVAGLMPRPPAGKVRAITTKAEPASELIGRRSELATLEAALAQGLGGRFTLLLVVADSGMGKTRLAETLIERATVPVGVNRCSDLEAELPYVALSLALLPLCGASGTGPMPLVRELLRRADLAQPFDEFARMRVMESLADVVQDLSPFLLVLDDVHWADAQTVAALGYLKRRCPNAPVVILLTCNRADLDRQPVRNLQTDLRIDLDELTETELAPFGAEAYAATGGHPMFLADWLQARQEGLNAGFTPALRERIVTQCWHLGPQAYRLLTVAAVLDEPFSASVLGQVVGVDQDICDELDLRVADRLLVSSGEGFSFRHSLVRRILAETFSPARHAQLRASANSITRGNPLRRRTDAGGEPSASGHLMELGIGPQVARAEAPAGIGWSPLSWSDPIDLPSPTSFAQSAHFQGRVVRG